MTIETKTNVQMIVPMQINAFRTLTELALVSEAEFCKMMGIETLPQLRKNQVDKAMCMLFEQGAQNHRLQVDNHG